MTQSNFPEVYTGWIPVREPVDGTGRYSFMQEFGATYRLAAKHVADGASTFDRDNPVVAYEQVRVTVELIEKA